MFGLGFVALGIGQGANSINLGDLFNSGGSSGTSISDLSSQVQSHPKDSGAWLQLARAYQADGQTSQAISSYTTYLGLKPNDQTALAATATLLEQRGQSDASKVQQAQAAAQAYTQVGSATAASSLRPNMTKKQRRQIQKQIVQFKLLAKSTPSPGSSSNPANPAP